MRRSLPHAVLIVLALTAPFAAAGETGFQAEVKVQKPTRLDWEFVAEGFGADAAKVPPDYLSYRQRYQLHVPEKYDEKKAWPLVVFLSPGDDPLGWRSWQKVCEENGIFFCAAYGAGNNHPAGVRLRIVLDMLDDVRRRYRIEPEQTYFTGLGDGGKLASTLAQSLPELCGGVVLICAAPAAPRLDYLRHRTQERLSTAFVTGEKDFNRREIEDNWHPYYRDLGIRSRLWSTKMGHEMPSGEVLAEAYAWLAEDLPRRRKDHEARPKLGVEPDEAFAGSALATRLLEAGQAEIVEPGRLYRGFMLLRGIEARWPKSEAAEKAALLVREMQLDRRLKETIAEQTAAEDQRTLAALGRARERLGDIAAALAAFEKLAANHADSDAGKQAAEETKRLKGKLAATPYVGIAFEVDGVTIQSVASDGPAQRAGLRAGDRLVKFGTAKIEALDDLRTALQALKPGDKTTAEIRRDGKVIAVAVEITGMPLRGGE